MALDFLPANRPIIEIDLTMTQELRSWMQLATDLITESEMLSGTGTPETFVSAPIKVRYMDAAGTTGNILYIKKLADIGGDATKGWILV